MGFSMNRVGRCMVYVGMPLITLDALPIREIFPGLRARLVHTDRVTHSWVDLDEGATFPDHHHPHEQIVSVLEGELEIVVERRALRADAGEGLRHPAARAARRPRADGLPRARRLRPGAGGL